MRKNKPAHARFIMKKFILERRFPDDIIARRTKVFPITIIANRIHKNINCSACNENMINKI
jgi:hypothetical protein